MRQLGRGLAFSVGVALALAATPPSLCDTPLTPKSVPVQIRLAEEMAANEDWEEAVRRWIDILYYFGPSDQEARADFELGSLALRRGRSDLAAAQWGKVVTRAPGSEWAERAEKALKLLGEEPPARPAEPAAPYVADGTPEDERQFLVAEADMAHGLVEFAIRDFLKVPNLYPASPRAAEARFRTGTCQALLGRPDLAIAQWERVTEDYAESAYARGAQSGIAAWRAVFEAVGLTESSPALGLDGDWRPFRDHGSAVARGLSYAEDLYENGNVTYALQEYAKVLCDIYTPQGEDNPHAAYARYRMGVCAYRLRHRDAAARQWRRLIEDRPGGEWAGRAARALAAVGATDPFSSDGGRLAPAVPDGLSTGLSKRFHLAAQLVDCELPLVAAKEYLKVIHVLTAGRPNPLQAEASYRLGECHHLRGRPDLACEVWQQTAASYPDTDWAAKAETAIAQAKVRQSALAASSITRER